MLTQMLIGTAMIITSVIIAGVFILVASSAMLRAGGWIVHRPHAPRFFAVLVITMIWLQVALSLVVALWAGLFMALGLLDTLEGAFYFSLVAFTTLGFGDVLLPQEWRLLSGFAAADGFLLFGLFTAYLAETMRRTREEQMRGVPERD